MIAALPNSRHAWLYQAYWRFRPGQQDTYSILSADNFVSDITCDFCLQAVVPVVPAPAPAPQPVGAAVVSAVVSAGAVFWYLI